MGQLGSLYGVPGSENNVARGTFVFNSPGTLTTVAGDNALFPRLTVEEPTLIDQLAVDIETAPTGQSVLIDFRKGKRSTGVLATAFAQLTLPVSTFFAVKDIPPMVIYPDEYLTVNVTQVGSVVAGSSATIIARAKKVPR